MSTNYYKILDLSIGASEKDIKKAYRKKALMYHPDKNPDDEEAATQFQRIQKAYDVLTDPLAKADHDSFLGKELAKFERESRLGEERKRKSADLEKKEMAARKRKQGVSDDNLKKIHIERLKAENIARQEELEMQMRKSSHQSRKEGKSTDLLLTQVKSVKVSWSKKKAHSTDDITSKFSVYGEIDIVVVRKNTAVIEYKDSMSIIRLLESAQVLKEQGFAVGQTSKPIDEYEADTLHRLNKGADS